MLLTRTYIVCLFTYFLHILCTFSCNTQDTETFCTTRICRQFSLSFRTGMLNTSSFFPSSRIGLLAVGLQGRLLVVGYQVPELVGYFLSTLLGGSRFPTVSYANEAQSDYILIVWCFKPGHDRGIFKISCRLRMS